MTKGSVPMREGTQRLILKWIAVLVVVILLLATFGCGTVPQETTIPTQHHELPLVDLVKVCNKGAVDNEPDLNGCFEWSNGVCHIYTLPRWVRETRDGDLTGYHRTLGHELDHCARGMFHGANKGVPLPRIAGRNF